MLCRPASLRQLCRDRGTDAPRYVVSWGTAHGPLLRQGSLRGQECPFSPGEARQEAYILTGGEARFEEGLSLASQESLQGVVSRLSHSGEWRVVGAEEFYTTVGHNEDESPVVFVLPGHMVDLAASPVTHVTRDGGEPLKRRRGDAHLLHAATGIGLLWQKRALRMEIPASLDWEGDVEPLLRQLLPVSPEPLPPVLPPSECPASVGTEALRSPLEQPRAFRLSDTDAVLRQPDWWGSPKPDGIRAELIQVASAGGGFERCMRGRGDCLHTRPEFCHPDVDAALASLGACRLDGELVVNRVDGAMLFVLFQVKQLQGEEIPPHDAVGALERTSGLLRGQRWIFCKHWARPGAAFATVASRYRPDRGTYRHDEGAEYPIDGWVFQRFSEIAKGQRQLPLKFKDTRHLNLDLGIDLEKKEAFYYSETGARMVLRGAKWNLHDELRLRRRLPRMPEGELCCEFSRSKGGDWIPQFARVKRPNAASTVRHTVATLQDHWEEGPFLRHMSGLQGEEGRGGGVQQELRCSAHYNRIAAAAREDGGRHREPYRDYQNWVKGHVLQEAMLAPQWGGEGEIYTTRRVLEIGAGKAGDIHKYARCMEMLQRRYPTSPVTVEWRLSDPGYRGEPSPLLEEARRREQQLRRETKARLSLDYLPLDIEEVLWSPSVAATSLTNVSAMFVLNYAISSEETARLYLQRIHHLLRPGGHLALCITDSDAVCAWKKKPIHVDPLVNIGGSPKKEWGSRYSPTIEGECSGVNGTLEEYVIPHQAFVGVAQRCGFEVVMNANHADLKNRLTAYRRCDKRKAVDDQMHIPGLYRAIVLRRPREKSHKQKRGRRGSDSNDKNKKPRGK